MISEPKRICFLLTAKNNGFKEVICWGTGNALREFLYVDDLAEACIFALNNWSISGKSCLNDNKKDLAWLNVGSGEEISIKNLSEIIANLVGYEGKINWDRDMPDGTPRKILDNSMINSLGWRPKITLREGLKLAIQDFENNFF